VLPQDARVIQTAGPSVQIKDSNKPVFLLVRSRLLTEALSESRHIVLLGGPGSGKSSFLRHVAVALAHAGDSDQPPDLPGWHAGLLLPLFASLGGYAAWVQQQQCDFDGDSLWDYLVSNNEHDPLRGLGDELRRAFRTGNLLLLLDGLDEVADPALRAAVAGATVELVGRQRGYVVVTCRVRSFDATLKRIFAEWREPVELAPFTLGQDRHFIQGWYARSVEQGVFTAAEARTRADQLIARIAEMDTLRDLARTPLLLTIITILHYYEGKLPEDRAALYEDMVQLLLTRWTQARREANTPPSLIDQLQVGGLKEYHLRQVLEELAYQAHQSRQSPDGRGLLHRGVVRERLIQLFQDFDLDEGVASVKAVLVLRYLEEESGCGAMTRQRRDWNAGSSAGISSTRSGGMTSASASPAPIIRSWACPGTKRSRFAAG
jgi:predicted NACHT family NTPase